jgi:hypothetical protein
LPVGGYDGIGGNIGYLSSAELFHSVQALKVFLSIYWTTPP